MPAVAKTRLIEHGSRPGQVCSRPLLHCPSRHPAQVPRVTPMLFRPIRNNRSGKLVKALNRPLSVGAVEMPWHVGPLLRWLR
jgi:hypothetical protein